jgi:hypothetical protein
MHAHYAMCRGSIHRIAGVKTGVLRLILWIPGGIENISLPVELTLLVTCGVDFVTCGVDFVTCGVDFVGYL